MSGETRYYFDFNFPLKVVQFILSLIFGTSKTAAQAIDTSVREWFSQPRPGSDKTVEVVSTIFKLPLSVSELTTDILRVPCTVEFWYLDRSNNWRQVLDMQRTPVRAYVSGSDALSWYKHHVKVYPIVAKQLQFRIVRSNDPALANVPYVTGLRSALIRRNVYDRAQGTQYFEEEQDVLGNVINKYIKDWSADKAFDDDPNTFWKSEPMPDPLAVVSMYLDVRAEDGTPKLIDKLYLDPVYSGQMLNLYYSSDDTVSTRKLSPITLWPDEDENTEWRVGSAGRVDVAPTGEDSYYRFSLAVGPLVAQEAWMGVEWIPNFPSEPTTAGPSIEPVLLRAINAGATQAFKPSVYYDVGAKEFVLSFDDGSGDPPVTYTATLTQDFAPGEPMRVMAGWTYGPDRVHLVINNRRNETVASYESAVSNLPQLVSFDGQVEMWNFAGSMTAAIIKLEYWHTSGAAFHANPTYYCNPDPVIPDEQGNVPSTTLDNAIYAVAWIAQEHGTGGAHETHYEDKEWTPIWKDYTTRKGMLFFPQTLSMKYLKLEFYNLNEAPYPIYESGIEVRYKVFPTSVIQTSTLGPRLYTGEGGPLGLGSFISLNGVRSVNWLSPASVLNAVGAVFTPQIPPVVIDQGNPYITESIPNNDNTKVSDTYRVELSSAYVYRRDALNPYILASDQYNTIIKAEGLGALADFTDIPWAEIEAANPGAISHVSSTVGAVPLRGSDWWVFPGQELKIPASVMEKLTATSTVTERKLTLEHRVRFNTTAIHRYAYKTLKRDAAIAYFAGVREVQPYTSTYIPGEDKPQFDFTRYDRDQWGWDEGEIRQLESGPVTAAGRIYRVNNLSFDNSLVGWTAGPTGHTWVQDNSQGHYALGSAKVTANEVAQELLSNRISVTPGEAIDFSTWVKWSSLVVTNGQGGITLGAVAYLDGEEVSRPVFGQVSYPDWTTHTSSGPNFVELTGSWTVPDGVDEIRVRLGLTTQAHSGSVWFDLVTLKDADFVWGTLSNQFTTQSDFAKAVLDFRDSGLIRSDSMWADVDQTSGSIDDTQLAWYTQTIPAVVPTGMWGDTIKTWGAAVDDGPIDPGVSTEWGTPFSIVSVTVDGMRRYQGNRVLHVIREAGTGEAGIQVRQFTNWVPFGLFRIGFVAYKPFANDNQIRLRLRRMSDGTFFYDQTLSMPVGRWFEYQTVFTEIPNVPDQEYELMLTMIGDDKDELYLSDLYTEIARIRYYCTLGGGVGPPLIEVSDLRYVQGYAQVVSPKPVNEMTVQVAILSPEAYAYGATITPAYLK